MASDPTIKRRILMRLKELREGGECTIYLLTIEGVKRKFHLLDESNTRVDKALCSLHDKKIIRCSRPTETSDETLTGELRAYKISLLKPDAEIGIS